MNDSAELLKQLRIDRKGKKKPRRRRWPWIAAVVAALAGTFVVFSGSRPVAVETAVARAASDGGPASVLDASGYVTARRIATVSSKITGKVLDVRIEEGQRVEEGQILATLDATDAQASQQLARAQLEAARAQLGEVQAQLSLANKTLERQRELVERRLVSQSALDQAQSERDSLQARLATVRRNVQVADDSLALSAISVDNTVVRAPFSGVIVAKAAQPGEMISPISAGGGFTRTGIGTLVDMDSLEVQVDVNEAYIGRVQPRMPVEVVLNAYPDWKIPAEVIAIIPTADRTKATVKVRIAFKEKDPRIVPDMGVRVSFLEERDPDAPPPTGVWVPTRAVATRDDATVVFVVQEGVARSVAVTAGETRDADRMISAGLSGGETVVLSPPERLRDGGRVTLPAAKP